MKLTKQEAATKWCPMSMNGQFTACCADACAAWEWIGRPVLEKRITLSAREICELAGSELPHNLNHLHPLVSDDQWHENMDHAKSLIGHAKVVAQLTPTEEWVANGQIEVCEEEGIAYLRIKRDVDTKLLGYCGLTRS